MSKKDTRINYISKIDGCRAIAVAAVLFSHYLPEGYITHDLPFGRWGVQLFFVISGYLITKILLNSKLKLESNTGKRTLLKVFYIRRILRIFPAYYLLLLGYLVFSVSFTQETFWSSIFYVFNIYEAVEPGNYEFLGHLWTLCIEEQFYLVWPWLMIFLPNKKIVYVTFLLLLLAPISRYILSEMNVPFNSIRNLPTSQLDSLCGGALLAQFQLGLHPMFEKYWRKALSFTFITGLILTVIPFIADMQSSLEVVFSLTGPALVSMVVIDQVSLNRFPRITAFLDFSPLRYLGKISYGIYLYQFISLFALYKLISLFEHPDWLSNDLGFAAIWMMLTFVTAFMSWFFYEKPILGVKRFFKY